MIQKVQADNGDWISGPATEPPDTTPAATLDTDTHPSGEQVDQVAELEEHIRRLIAQAPPLAPEQIDRLRALFPPVPATTGGGDR